MTIRHVCAAIAAAAVLLMGSAELLASGAKKVPEVFRATTSNMTPDGLALKIDILDWSGNEAREAVLSVLTEESDTALEDLPTTGYVWPENSGLGYAVKYAHRVETPEGGERITLVTGRPLGTFSREPWATPGSDATANDFSVIELHLGSDQSGTGRLSLAAEVSFDREAHTVSLNSDEDGPALLDPVTREPPPYWARESEP